MLEKVIFNLKLRHSILILALAFKAKNNNEKCKIQHAKFKAQLFLLPAKLVTIFDEIYFSESIVIWRAEASPLDVLEPPLQSTALLSWSTSLLRSSSWLATPPRTWRWRESPPDIFSLPSEVGQILLLFMTNIFEKITLKYFLEK